MENDFATGLHRFDYHIPECIPILILLLCLCLTSGDVLDFGGSRILPKILAE